MIHVQGIAKSFGRTAAVRSVSFHAGDGAITGLLGANGAGKSTTLRMIAGVLEPDAGRIDVGAGGRGRPHLGALLDHTGLYGRLTARENLEFFRRLHGMAPEVLRARVASVLASLGLSAVADRQSRASPRAST